MSYKDPDRLASNIGKLPEGTSLPSKARTVAIYLLLGLVTLGLPFVCAMRRIGGDAAPVAKPITPPARETVVEPTTAPPPPASRPSEPPLTARERKVLRAEIVLAEIDPTVQSIRIAWPNTLNVPWRWPTWVDLAKFGALLDELVKVAGEEPALSELDTALLTYALAMRRDVIVLHDLVTRWNGLEAGGTRPPTDELVPVFERLGATSQAVYPALRRARPLGTGRPGSVVALHDECIAATEILSRMPNAVPAVVEAPAATAFPLKPPISELRLLGKTCMRTAIDVADAAAELDGRTVELAVGIGLAMFHEADAAKRANYVSWTGNIAQPVAFLAQRSALR